MTVVDLFRYYRLAEDLPVVQHSCDTVRLGSAPGRQALLVGVPPSAAQVLARLDGSRTLADVIADLGADRDWLPLFEHLLEHGYLASDGAAKRSRPQSLIPAQRAERPGRGSAQPQRRSTARDDAVVAVYGANALAVRIAELLDDAQVGLVHLPLPDPSCPATLPVPLPTGTRSHIRYYPLATHMRPTATILTDVAGVREASHAAALVRDVVPHLIAVGGVQQAFVGPLVLPQRSPCWNCLQRQGAPGYPAASTATGELHLEVAAVMAARQMLQFVDGNNQPESVGATLRWRASDSAPSRMRWSFHPECACRVYEQRSR